MPLIKIKPCSFQKTIFPTKECYFFPKQPKNISHASNDNKNRYDTNSPQLYETLYQAPFVALYIILQCIWATSQSSGLLLSGLTLQLNWQYTFMKWIFLEGLIWDRLLFEKLKWIVPPCLTPQSFSVLWKYKLTYPSIFHKFSYTN